MGIIIKTLNSPGPTMPFSKRETLDIEHNWVWVAFRRDPATEVWHLQGIASSETLAIEMCMDETYFIGPIPLDAALPTHKLEWIGSYFPLCPA